MLVSRKKSLRRQTETIGDTKAVPAGAKPELLHVFDIVDQALAYMRSLAVSTAIIAAQTLSRTCGRIGYLSLRKRSDIKQLAGDGRLQYVRRDFISAFSWADVAGSFTYVPR